MSQETVESSTLPAPAGSADAADPRITRRINPRAVVAQLVERKLPKRRLGGVRTSESAAVAGDLGALTVRAQPRVSGPIGVDPVASGQRCTLMGRPLARCVLNSREGAG